MIFYKNIIFILIIIFFLFIDIPFFEKSMSLYHRNKIYADHSQNSNSEKYFNQVLNSLETNSILITEGRDTEVFSALYYNYVEERRKDINIYDQQGNVFSRLYGDIYNPPIDYKWIIDLRNYQLFSMNKPVYLNWRKAGVGKLSLSYLKNKKKELEVFLKKKPQLIDKSRTLGFEIKDKKSLRYTVNNIVNESIFNSTFKNGEHFSKYDFKDNGRWYLRQRGLLYKILNVRYSIIEVLSVVGEMDLNGFMESVEFLTQLRMSKNVLKGMVLELEKEGLLFRKGESIFFKRDLEMFSNYSFEKKNQLEYEKKASYNWSLMNRDIFIMHALLLSDKDVTDYQLSQFALLYWIKKDNKLKIAFFKDKLNRYKENVILRLRKIYPYLNKNFLDMRIFSRLDRVGAKKEIVSVIKRFRQDSDNAYKVDFYLAETYKEMGKLYNNKDYFKDAIIYYETALDKLDYFSRQRNRLKKSIKDYNYIVHSVDQTNALLRYDDEYLNNLKNNGNKVLLGKTYFLRGEYNNAYEYLLQAFKTNGISIQKDIWKMLYDSAKKINKVEYIVETMNLLLLSNVLDEEYFHKMFNNLLNILIYWSDQSKKTGDFYKSMLIDKKIDKLLNDYKDRLGINFYLKHKKTIQNRLKK